MKYEQNHQIKHREFENSSTGSVDFLLQAKILVLQPIHLTDGGGGGPDGWAAAEEARTDASGGGPEGRRQRRRPGGMVAGEARMGGSGGGLEGRQQRRRPGGTGTEEARTGGGIGGGLSAAAAEAEAIAICEESVRLKGSVMNQGRVW